MIKNVVIFRIKNIFFPFCSRYRDEVYEVCFFITFISVSFVNLKTKKFLEEEFLVFFCKLKITKEGYVEEMFIWSNVSCTKNFSFI